MRQLISKNLLPILIMGLCVCIIPDAFASTGGGGLSDLVDDLKEMLDTWVAQGVILCAFGFALFRCVTKFDFMSIGGALLLALVIAYGPDFLLSLTGATI